MSLQEAITALGQLKSCLERELTAAQHIRDAFRTMDAAAVLERANDRAVFTEEAREIERHVIAALEAVAIEAKVEPLRLDALLPLYEADVARVRRLLDETRTLAEALVDVEARNRLLLDRAQKVVQSYLLAVTQQGSPSAYDRRGHRVLPGGSTPTP